MRFSAVPLFAVALLSLTVDGAAQDRSSLGADPLAPPFDPPTFGVPRQQSRHDRPKLGAAGNGDYAFWIGPYSVVSPSQDAIGLWSVFRVTFMLCSSLFQGEKSLVEASPKGFVLERGDVHALGFGGDRWDGGWYAITVTGDSEKDAGGGHPAWEIRFDDDGTLLECGVTLESRSSSASVADHEKSVEYLYIGLPQSFSAVITEPRNLGLRTLSPIGLIHLVAPCGRTWCQLSTLYDLSPGKWFVDFRIRFNYASDVQDTKQ